MPRFVDVEKAEFPYLSMSLYGINSKDCKAYNEGVKATEDMIQALPIADVVEVKHGEWIKCQKLYGIGYEYVCSICEKGIRQYEGQPICSECGAKMYGGKTE